MHCGAAQCRNRASMSWQSAWLPSRTPLMKSCRPSRVEVPYSRPSGASTAPVRPSSPAGSPSEPSEQGSQPPRCRSARQKRPCTSWRPYIGASLRTFPPRRLSRVPSETSLTVGSTSSTTTPRMEPHNQQAQNGNARPPPTSTVGCLERGAGLRRCAAAVPAGADGG